MGEPSYKVTYFNGKGNGQILRLVLAAAGIKFVDERLTGEEWAKRKQDTPTKQLPNLTIKENGKETVYGQSKSCARYLAKRYGLFGSSPEEGFLIDEVMECVADTFQEFVKFFLEKDEAKKAEIKKNLAEKTIPNLTAYIKHRKEDYGKNGFIIGKTISVADMYFYIIADMFDDELFVTTWKKCSDAWKVTELVKANEKIAAWLATQSKPAK